MITSNPFTIVAIVVIAMWLLLVIPALACVMLSSRLSQQEESRQDSFSPQWVPQAVRIHSNRPKRLF
jgi:biopolymer transport protein ExbB/TolQ